MEIKSLFCSLFGHSDNKMPSSLGRTREKETNAFNLGASILQDKEEPVKNNEEQKPTKKDESEAKEKEETAPASSTYNLIILDESGSMSDVRNQTITGCNETLNCIRNTAKDQPDIKQFVSIFCFDNKNSRYIFQNVPVEETRDLTTADYSPNSCTPLYDAIGYTVTQLQSIISDSDSVAVVTIITDGYENASRRWNHYSVVELIERLKKKGWVFTFIGANIDVEQTAKGLGIDSFMEFEQSDLGMRDMFEQERRSRRAYSEKRYYLKNMLNYASMPCEERAEILGAMNNNFFVDKERTSPNFIKKLEDNEVFVFGSNVLGQHSSGAALYAKEHFGAIAGIPEGIQGKSYAIPTYGNTFHELEDAVKRFTEYAAMHPQNFFMLTAIGCGAAGYSVEQIAPLFRQAYTFGNVYVPEGFLPFMPKFFNQ